MSMNARTALVKMEQRVLTNQGATNVNVPVDIRVNAVTQVSWQLSQRKMKEGFVKELRYRVVEWNTKIWNIKRVEKG